MNRSVVKVTTSLLTATVLFMSMLQPFGAYVPDADAFSQFSWVEESSQPVTPARKAQPKGFETSSTYKYSAIKKRIESYKETNKDVMGWLTIPGTNINEPILFNNQNNDYYINRDWKGVDYPSNNWQNYAVTAAFADCRTKWGETWKKSSKNTVLYGHNWTNLRSPLDIGANNNHVMFGQLPSYTDLNFAQSNPYIYYSTGENEGIWKVFSVGYCELSSSFNYNSPNPTNEAYQTLLTEWKARSIFNFNVDVNTDDRILTLSTCTRQYDVGENQRFIIVARLLRDGESESDNVSVSINNNVKGPQF